MSTLRKIRKLLDTKGGAKAVIFVPDSATGDTIRKTLTKHGIGINAFIVSNRPIFEKVLEATTTDRPREEESKVSEG